jgi:hypothetical protein
VLLVAYTISIDECDKGDDPYQCKTCDVEDGKKCGLCNDGDYLKDGKCYNCFEKIIGCKKCSSENECEVCENNYLKKDKKCVASYELIPGCMIAEENDNIYSCKKCFAGFVIPENKTTCEKCPENCQKCQTVDKCEKCKEYFYLKDNKCTSCPENCKECNDEDGKCTECNSGFTLISADKCVKCEVENCKECETGNSKICKECNEKFGIIGDDKSKCSPCEGTNCTTCTSKQNQMFTGIPQKCTGCSIGSFLDDTTGKCAACALGNCYCAGSTDCQGCIDGFYSSSDEGIKCDKKCSEKFEHCLQCSRTKCDQCEDGFGVEKTHCLPVDTFFPHCVKGNSNGCTQCEKGYTLYSLKNCVSASGYLKVSIFVFLLALLFI